VAYDEELADRVRRALAPREGLSEKKMFGGIAFMLHGNMSCGVEKDQLMVRVGPERHEEALAQPHARPMDFTGRAMRGMVYVTPEGCRTDEALKRWVEQGLNFAATLPPK
jgi:TfoX/Sxy family transcriptional regulator of competence genes